MWAGGFGLVVIVTPAGSGPTSLLYAEGAPSTKIQKPGMMPSFCTTDLPE
jgi:hypothetical protein